VKAAKPPVTPALRLLRERAVAFAPHCYDYVEKGGTAHSAACLGVPEHSVIKTLVMEDQDREPLLVLMHGDRQVSTKNLARQIGARAVTPCSPEVANRHTGYLVGGTSPFGTRKPLRIFVESTVFDLDRIYINGGKRGFLVSLDPADLRRVLEVTLVQAAIED
jgi:Cys-tRNA(Pro) deacylase